jgi:hypothetical protein
VCPSLAHSKCRAVARALFAHMTLLSHKKVTVQLQRCECTAHICFVGGSASDGELHDTHRCERTNACLGTALIQTSKTTRTGRSDASPSQRVPLPLHRDKRAMRACCRCTGLDGNRSRQRISGSLVLCSDSRQSSTHPSRAAVR